MRVCHYNVPLSNVYGSLRGTKGSSTHITVDFCFSFPSSIFFQLLLAIVLLSWGYVIYASTVAARRQLKKEYPDKIFGMNENL